MGDHDWILSVPAAKWIIPVMKEIAREQYKMSVGDLENQSFKQLRNYVFSQASIMGLYEIYGTRGKKALSDTVVSMVSPTESLNRR